MTSGVTFMYTGCKMSHCRHPAQRESNPSLAQAPAPAPSPAPAPAPAPSGVSRVRRNLFGSGAVNQEDNVKFGREELGRITRSDRERWNFDFEREAPLEGRYRWEKVGEEGVPKAYSLPGMTYLSAHAAHTTPTPTTEPTPTQPSVNRTAQATTTTTTTTTTATEQPVATTPTTTKELSTTQATINTTTTTTAQPTTSIAHQQSTTTAAESTTATTTTVLSTTTVTVLSTAAVQSSATTARSTTATRRQPSITTAAAAATTTTTTADTGKCGGVVTRSRPKTTQPQLTDFMKIQKRGVNRKREEEPQQQGTLKRTKTS